MLYGYFEAHFMLNQQKRTTIVTFDGEVLFKTWRHSFRNVDYFLYRADIDSADSQTKHEKSIWNGCKSALKVRLCEKLLAHDLASSFFWICNPCIQTQICNPCLMPNQHLFAARIVVDWSRQMKELKRKPSSCYRHDNPPERQIPRMTTNFQWTFSKSIFMQTQTTPHHCPS